MASMNLHVQGNVEVLTDEELQTRQDYAPLQEVLEAAYQQAASGKGRERHVAGAREPFTQQVICQGGRRYGRSALLFQAHKKAEESQRLPPARAEAELLGAIVYLAAAVVLLREEQESVDGRP